MDFRNWKLNCEINGVVVAERGNEFLFWNFDLARGVRTQQPAAWSLTTRLWVRHGVILLRTDEALYVIPLPCVSPDARNPTTLPDDVPFEWAREVCSKYFDALLAPASVSASSPLPLVVTLRGEVWRCI